MNRSEWPEWAPPEATKYCDECLDEGYLEANDLKKLLTHPDADKFIWQKLKKLRIEPKSFCIAFVEALNGSAFLDKTPKQYDDFFKDLSEKSFELALFFAEAPELDRLLLDQYSKHLIRMKDAGVLSDIDIHAGDYIPPSISALLRDISSEADDRRLNRGGEVLFTSPLDDEGVFHHQIHKKYFIKKITDFFRLKTGKPCRPIVELCVEVCFGHDDYTDINFLTRMKK